MLLIWRECTDTSYPVWHFLFVSPSPRPVANRKYEKQEPLEAPSRKLSDRKANAQAAFQDQFDTRLQFRELEPRVVLAADAVYDAMNQTLTITVEDGDSVEIGRSGMDNFLYVSGLDSSSGDGAFMGDTLTLDTATLNSITITDTNTNNSLDPSMVAFLATLADGPDLDLTTGTTTLDNVDSVSIDVGAEVRVGTFDVLSSGTNTDDATVTIAGQIIGDVNVDVTNTTAKTLDVTSTDQGSVTGTTLTINRDATAGAVVSTFPKERMTSIASPKLRPAKKSVSL